MLFLTLIAGIVSLYAGAEWLVRGASRLARRLGVSPLVIGLTVIGFGTSAPELLVTIVASLRDQSGVALGNVTGSNILNIALIMGVAALIRPLRLGTKVILREISVMVVATAAFVLALVSGDGISRLEGLALLGGFVAYMGFTTWDARRGSSEVRKEFEDFEHARKLDRARSVVLDAAFVFGGLIALIAGARWFLSAAVTFGQRAGMSELVIGLTIVAIGTSLPELATSIVAAIRGETDIVIGNVVGSNIFNILLNIGAAACVHPLLVDRSALSFDLVALSIVTVVVLPMTRTRKAIGRWEGGILLIGYALYTTLLLMRS